MSVKVVNLNVIYAFQLANSKWNDILKHYSQDVFCQFTERDSSRRQTRFLETISKRHMQADRRI